MRAPKRQHLTTFQRSLNDTARNLGVRAPIVATPGLIKLNLALGFRLNQCDGLGMGLNQFGVS